MYQDVHKLFGATRNTSPDTGKQSYLWFVTLNTDKTVNTGVGTYLAAEILSSAENYKNFVIAIRPTLENGEIMEAIVSQWSERSAQYLKYNVNTGIVTQRSAIVYQNYMFAGSFMPGSPITRQDSANVNLYEAYTVGFGEGSTGPVI